MEVWISEVQIREVPLYIEENQTSNLFLSSCQTQSNPYNTAFKKSCNSCYVSAVHFSCVWDLLDMVTIMRWSY